MGVPFIGAFGMQQIPDVGLRNHEQGCRLGWCPGRGEGWGVGRQGVGLATEKGSG